MQLEVIGCLGGPQPHGVDSVVLVAWHWGVVWHGQHHLAKRDTIRIQSARDMVPSAGSTHGAVPASQEAAFCLPAVFCSSSSGFFPSAQNTPNLPQARLSPKPLPALLYTCTCSPSSQDACEGLTGQPLNTLQRLHCLSKLTCFSTGISSTILPTSAP